MAAVCDPVSDELIFESDFIAVAEPEKPDSQECVATTRSNRRTSVTDPRTGSGIVAWESSSYRGLIQASAMRFPSVRLELRDRPQRCVLGWSAPACGMRAMMVEIGLEIEQLAFEIGGCPEQATVQALSAEGVRSEKSERSSLRVRGMKVSA